MQNTDDLKLLRVDPFSVEEIVGLKKAKRWRGVLLDTTRRLDSPTALKAGAKLSPEGKVIYVPHAYDFTLSDFMNHRFRAGTSRTQKSLLGDESIKQKYSTIGLHTFNPVPSGGSAHSCKLN